MIDTKRWGILYCPHTEWIPGITAKRREKIQKCLDNEHIAYDLIQSEDTGSVDRLVNMLINNGYKTIIIVGGDSALNDAVNCLMMTDKTTRDSITLGVIPNGLMNDFAHFWGINEHEITKNIKLLKQHKTRKIDLGCIHYHNNHGEACHRYFLNCINIGLIAAIMNLRSKTRHMLGSRTLSFIFSFILLIFQRMEYKMHIRINTDEIKRNIMTVCIGNALGYGQTPNAVPYNGMLDVSVVYHAGVTQLIEGIYLFVRGKILNHHSVHPYRTQKIEFLKASHALVVIDGRLMRTPQGPFTVNVVQEVINFLVP